MPEDFDIQFFQLVLSLQAGAMQQMGKVAHPVTGKVERDLTLAKHSIDMLEMLDRKTKGNLSPDEKKLIDHVLYELRLNYVDEIKKDQETGPKQSQNQSQADDQPAQSTGTAADSQENS